MYLNILNYIKILNALNAQRTLLVHFQRYAALFRKQSIQIIRASVKTLIRSKI